MNTDKIIQTYKIKINKWNILYECIYLYVVFFFENRYIVTRHVKHHDGAYRREEEEGGRGVAGGGNQNFFNIMHKTPIFIFKINFFPRFVRISGNL